MQFTALNFKCIKSDVGIPSRTIIKRFRNIYKPRRLTKKPTKFVLLSSLKISGILSGRIQKVFIRISCEFRIKNLCIYTYTYCG